ADLRQGRRAWKAAAICRVHPGRQDYRFPRRHRAGPVLQASLYAARDCCPGEKALNPSCWLARIPDRLSAQCLIDRAQDRSRGEFVEAPAVAVQMPFAAELLAWQAR